MFVFILIDTSVCVSVCPLYVYAHGQAGHLMFTKTLSLFDVSVMAAFNIRKRNNLKEACNIGPTAVSVYIMLLNSRKEIKSLNLTQSYSVLFQCLMRPKLKIGNQVIRYCTQKLEMQTIAAYMIL